MICACLRPSPIVPLAAHTRPFTQGHLPVQRLGPGLTRCSTEGTSSIGDGTRFLLPFLHILTVLYLK